MYESHWGLRESPFRSLADPRYFFSSPTHEEALARLLFLVENRRRLGLLIGPAGSGKTMLLEVLARQFRAAGCAVASLNLLSVGVRELLWELATQLRSGPGVSDTIFELWRAMVDRLAENRYQQLPTVMLLDDADEASTDVLLYVSRLLNNDTSSECPLTIVLASDQQHLGRLGRRILDLSELRIELEPWDPVETSHFLQSSLSKAGIDREVFDTEAQARLHALTAGIPRLVSSLAELALVAGAGHQMPQIDGPMIDSVYEELTAGR